MAPGRKRQRLSQDGTAAVTAIADTEAPADAHEPVPTDEAVRKQNLKQRRSLFVRSLAPTVTTDDLTDHFSESYPIKHAVAVLDPASQQCKGFGFVTFADAEDAQRALEELNGSELKGKKIRVEYAEARQRDVDSEIPGHKKSTPSAASTKAKAEREQQRKEQAPPRLIIRNLPWSVKTGNQLALLFRSYGKVKYAEVPKSNSGQLKGFGFVLLRGKSNAEKALQGVNGKEVDGRTLAVDWAVDKDTWQELQNKDQDGDAQMEDAGEEGSDDSDAESSVVSSSDEDSDEDQDEDDEDEDDDGSNTDYEDVSDSEDGGVEINTDSTKPNLTANTLFVRNLPFSADDESLEEHFSQFGKLRYARIVLDHDTERPKGTGFVCFVDENDATECLKGVPRVRLQQRTVDKKDGSQITVSHSVLENEESDPTGKYTMDGRVLAISRAVDRNEATRLTAEGAASRFKRDKDKRRLYLLSEGTISQGTPLYEKLSPSEVTMREASAKQRQKLIQGNPSLHLSLTRLSIRNIPRSITSKQLKELARKAVVGFAEDVKAGKRQKLNKEETVRGGEAMVVAEKMRKKRGKGLVKQAKIVFETTEGSKVGEDTGAGRSRGYGFIEYYTHRNALMGLRWLNGHAVDYRVKGEQPKGKKAQQEAVEDRKKRLIVEFAIENANVVNRRSDREVKSREGPKSQLEAGKAGSAPARGDKGKGKKRKRDDADAAASPLGAKTKGKGGKGLKSGGQAAERGNGADVQGKDGKIAQRSNIIRKKRMARRARKAGKA
jgi:nucleolar protein 4